MKSRCRLYLTAALVILMTSLLPALARPQNASPPGLGAPDKAWVARTMRSLSLRDKIAQLIQVRVMGRFMNRQSPQFLSLQDEIGRNHVGGLVLFAGNVYESAVLLNRLQSMSKLPLVVCADFERGASFRIADTTSFPWTMAIGATGSEDFAYQEGVVTGREARALGVQWIFAPVMDVNNNPDNPVINIRSFGEDPQLVARLGAAFIRGAHEGGVLATAKHFPGHGDTATDTHIGLAVIPSDMQRLNAVELVPFRRAIEAGVDAVMTAHIAVPKVTGEPGLPATLSPKILTGLLRDQLKFKGLIVTDAMEMGGITTRFWTGLAAVRAIEAGADMLLLPPDTTVAIDEVERAVRRGDISEERINRSVERVLEAKSRVGLNRVRTVALDHIDEAVAKLDNQALAQTMADRSITLVKDEKHLLPIDPRDPPKLYSLVISSDMETSPGAVFQSELRRRFLNARTAAVDPRISDELVSGILKTASESDVIILSTLVRVISGSGSISLAQNQRGLIDKLIASGKPIVWIAFGNPYLLRLYPQIPTYLCTFSYSDVSQIAAAKALAGEIAVTGRMPVSIPQYTKVGDGLQLPELDMKLKQASPSAMGLPEGAFDKTRKLISDLLENKAFPGVSVAVGYRGTVVLSDSRGRVEYDAASPRVTEDTAFQLGTLSTSVGTATAAMMLAESGRLLLNTPVQDYLPEFRGPGKDKVYVEQLLAQSSGLPATLAPAARAAGRQAMIKAICDEPLLYPPGSRHVYSDPGMVLLAEILSRVSGEPADQYLTGHLFKPLDMKSTSYGPAQGPQRSAKPAASERLFSSTRDLPVFAQMMINGGIYDHRRYLRPGTITRFTTSQDKSGDALGWSKPSSSSWTGRVFSPAAYGQIDPEGSMLWIDPDKKLFIILLTSRMNPSWEGERIEEARESICESIVEAIP